MVTLCILITILMIVCLFGNLIYMIISILRGDVLWSMVCAFGLCMSYNMIGNFTTATVELINKGL